MSATASFRMWMQGCSPALEQMTTSPPLRVRRHSAPLPGSVRGTVASVTTGQESLRRRRAAPPSLAAPLGPASLLLLGAMAGSLILLILLQANAVRGCTTIAVGREATIDGSLMVTHNNDCEDCDVRIGVVPSVEHSGKPGDDSCPIHPCAFDFPRYVGNDRGPLYTLEHLKLEGLADWNPVETVPLGHIAQPKGRTYRYFDGTYGMMNEHQLAIGESTCGAKIAAYSVARGGEAMMEASVLTRLALQRCKTARCAVELMGHLAETHGFTGSEDPVEEGTAMFDVAGEALTVIDTREAWVMHLLADASGRSAIWAAQRVPDDHVAVVPNHFVIDRINVSDSANFLASHDIVGAAVAAGLVKSEDVEREGGADNFHFSRTFALDFHDPDGGKGERRRWRIFSLLAPSMNLSAAANGHSVADAARMSSRLPFSVRVDPDRRVGVRDVMALMRDHYEGTPFDQTKGLAAGPYGAPNRYDRSKSMQEASQGFFERSVSIHRTSYSFVAQAKEVTGDSAVGSVINGGTLWFAHHTPASSLYLPLPCSSLSLPSSFSRGSLYRLDRSSAWWAFAAVANNAERMYQPIHNYIAQRQDKLEVESQQRLEQAQQKAVQLAAAGQTKQAQQFITKFTVEHNQKLVDQWWQLLDELTYTFRDGVMLQTAHPPLKQKHIFYPLWWLKEVGYFSRGALSTPTYPAVPVRLHPVGNSTAVTAHTVAPVDAKVQPSTSSRGGATSVAAKSLTPVQRLARRSATTTTLTTRHRRGNVLAETTAAPTVESEEEEGEEEDEEAAAAAPADQPPASDLPSSSSAAYQSQQGQQQSRNRASTTGGKVAAAEGEEEEEEEEPGRRPSTWDFLRSKRIGFPIAVALFSASLLLVACACFHVGRAWANWRRRRDGYEAVRGGSDEEAARAAEAAEAARMGFGPREGLSSTGERVVLSTR